MLLHVLHPVVTCSPHLWQAKGAVRETAPCVSSRTICRNSPRINGELARRLCLVNCDSKVMRGAKGTLPSKVYKFVVCGRASRVDRTARQKLEMRIFLWISWVSAVDLIQL